MSFCGGRSDEEVQRHMTALTTMQWGAMRRSSAI
jgi:hypothetical protein